MIWFFIMMGDFEFLSLGGYLFNEVEIKDGNFRLVIEI